VLRLLLLLALTLNSLLLLPLLVIRAQPFDDQGLRRFLSQDEHCLPPCLLGILPGQTRFYQALLGLNAHQWVADAYNNQNVLLGEPARILWTWNGQQPAFLHPERGGSVFSRNGIEIDDVMLDIGLPLGELWIALGPPDDYRVFSVDGTTLFEGTFLAFNSYYANPQITVMGVIPCPYHAALWETSIALRVELPQEPAEMPQNPQSLPRSAVELQRQLCPATP
jgi:hypothetical protein